jgi:UDP-2,3-diacylglucosamine hydrolase
LRAFADLRDGGVKLFFVCGNHDFWAGRFLHDDLDMTIAERLELEVNGQRTLFVHGDGINPKDVGYRVYKRIARFPLVVGAFRLLHPDWAMGLAQWVSRSSRHLFTPDDPSQGSEVEPLLAFAQRTLEAGEADVVMCGHSHYPIHETFPTPNGTGDYFNTGDWVVHQSYVEWDGDEIQLRRWEPGLAQIEAGGKAESAPDQADQQHHE